MYRRRRIGLVLGIIALAVAIWLLVAQPWRGAALETAATPTPATASDFPVREPTDRAAPTPDAIAIPWPAPTVELTPEIQPCVARDVAVEALTDQDTYTSGQNPQLSIKLTNNGAADCTLNVGTSAQSFTIASGSDVWWRSTDCQTEPSDTVVVLAAGQSVARRPAPLTWDRTRSSVSTCGGESRQNAPAVVVPSERRDRRHPGDAVEADPALLTCFTESQRLSPTREMSPEEGTDRFLPGAYCG